ncbi:tetratricopeptide repeat protein [Nocardia sp. No.11]|uniref:tetratricopeptide repeat protein n=1 Tax=Nocardia sp. No.11 TaxID=3128861 RepID=UPI00319DDB98
MRFEGPVGRPPAPPVSILADHGSVAAANIEHFHYHAPENRRSAAVVQLLAAGSLGVRLVGRGDELAEIASVLALPASGNLRAAIPVVSGPPGVGKSELARHAGVAAAELGTFAQVAFVDMHGYDPDPDVRVQPASVYAAALVQLGFNRSDLPNGTVELAAAYQIHLAGLAKTAHRVLLILDNVGDVAQIESLLPDDSAHRVVVTSRETLAAIPQARIVEVEVLSQDSAVSLVVEAVASRIPGDSRLGDATVLGELVSLCGHLPLALQIVAALLADEPQRQVADLVVELRAEGTRLSGLDYDGNWSVRAAFELSYRRLGTDLAVLFALLPAVPGVDTGLVAAAALTQDCEIAVRRKLMRLVRAHLVERPIDERWHLHDLIRLYAKELSDADPSATLAAFVRVAFRLGLRITIAGAQAMGEPRPALPARLPVLNAAEVAAPFPDAERAAAWLVAERQTIVALIERLADREEWRRHIRETAYPICVIFDRLRFLDELIAVATTWSVAAAAVGDRESEANALDQLSAGLRKARRFDEALDVIVQARKIYREMGNRVGEGAALNNQANILQEFSRFDEAIELYRTDIEICCQTGELAGEARASNNLGGVLIKAGRPIEAAAAIERAANLFAQVGDRRGTAQALNNAGSALQSGRHWDDAGRLHRRAAAAFLEVGDRHGELGALNNLAVAMMMDGRNNEAIEILQGVRRTASQMNDQRLEADVLDNIGLAHQHEGRPAAAISAHTESSAVAAGIGDLFAEGRAQYLLSDALLADSSRSEAIDASRRAIRLFDQAGAPEIAQAREQLLKLETDSHD